jgi:manganese-dependent inorganic pyrophosphatase
VVGIDDADVVGVVDHHRVADFQTRTPTFMRVEPVGATSTIVAKLFVENSVDIPQPIAGVLLAGILADTLLFHGPTTTPEDRRVAALLAERAGVEIDQFGASILRRASDLTGRSAEQLLMSDFKEFTAEGVHFGIGTIETASGEDVLARREDLLKEMKAKCERGGFASIIFAIIDIVEARTDLLVVGYPEALAAAFDAPLEDGVLIHIPGILSRKKNIVPLLGNVAHLIPRR